MKPVRKTRNAQINKSRETIDTEIRRHLERKEFVQAATLALRDMDQERMHTICDQGIGHYNGVLRSMCKSPSKIKAHMQLIARASAYAEMSQLHTLKGEHETAEECQRISRTARQAHIELSRIKR